MYKEEKGHYKEVKHHLGGMPNGCQHKIKVMPMSQS